MNTKSTVSRAEIGSNKKLPRSVLVVLSYNAREIAVCDAYIIRLTVRWIRTSGTKDPCRLSRNSSMLEETW